MRHPLLPPDVLPGSDRHGRIRPSATSTRRSAASRAGRSLPSATSTSRAHSGSAGGPRCPQPRGQSSIAAARSSNAAGTSSGVTWARPKDRTPGVSTTQPRPSGSGRAIAADRRVAALPDGRDHARGPRRVRDAAVDQRGLAHARMPDQHRDAARRAARRARRAAVAAGDDHGHLQLAVRRRERLGIAEVGLGEAQHRREAARVRRDQAAVDEARARHRVGHRRDDDELLGVGHHQPLDGVGRRRRCGAARWRAPRRGRCARACPARRKGRRPARPGRPRRSACGPAPAPASR